MSDSAGRATSFSQVAPRFVSRSAPPDTSYNGPFTTVPEPTPTPHGDLSEEDRAALCDPHSLPTIEEIVAKLLDPPRQDFNKHTNLLYVSMEWVLKQVDGRHFFVDLKDGMRYLHPMSKIKTHGKQAGLPEGYFRWLCEHQLERREDQYTVPSRFEYFPLRADQARKRKWYAPELFDTAR